MQKQNLNCHFLCVNGNYCLISTNLSEIFLLSGASASAEVLRSSAEAETPNSTI